MQIEISTQEANQLEQLLQNRTDAESLRMKRYLEMPDLSRTPGSPLKEMVDRILALPDFQTFDIIKVPEIVPADISFDLFNFPPDHPARSKSDTYYVDEQNILRTHTTVMWWYYLKHAETLKKISSKQPLAVLSYGKVYRKDEIDRQHMNIFHQIDGLLLWPTADKKISITDLQKVLTDIAKTIYGEQINCRFNNDTFPYTDPSLEMEIEINGNWVEVLGSGLVRQTVLDKLGLAPRSYNGWAFGFGLERLAIISMDLPDIRLLWSQDQRVIKQLRLGQKYVEVSKFPPITRDISFIVDKNFMPNNYFDLIRDIGGDLVEQVELLDKYEDGEKFGADKISYTYRVVYRSPDKTLKTEEVEPLQTKLYNETAKQFNAQLR